MISRMTTATTGALYQSFSPKWLVRDGCHSHSCERFQEFSIRSPSVGVCGDTKGYVGRRNSSRDSRLCVFRSSKCRATRLHPVSSTSSVQSHSYSSQTAESE